MLRLTGDGCERWQIVTHGGEAYPARLEDKAVHFVTDLGREAAFQKLKKQKTEEKGGQTF